MKNLKVLYLVSFLEGAALMAAELLSAKIMAPFFGTSLVVWTSIFVITLSALALGYFLGAKISIKFKPEKILLQILVFSSFYFAFTYPISSFVMSQSLSLSLEIGALISAFVFLFPLLMCFGIVSPLVIKIITLNISESGEKSSIIYTISTIGGIISSLSFGLYFIPDIGLKGSIYIASTFVFMASILTFFIQKKSKNG